MLHSHTLSNINRLLKALKLTIYLLRSAARFVTSVCAMLNAITVIHGWQFAAARDIVAQVHAARVVCETFLLRISRIYKCAFINLRVLTGLLHP